MKKDETSGVKCFKYALNVGLVIVMCSSFSCSWGVHVLFVTVGFSCARTWIG
jgi:hypothetical protein